MSPIYPKRKRGISEEAMMTMMMKRRKGMSWSCRGNIWTRSEIGGIEIIQVKKYPIVCRTPMRKEKVSPKCSLAFAEWYLGSQSVVVKASDRCPFSRR